jgi:hypothetical protein
MSNHVAIRAGKLVWQIESTPHAIVQCGKFATTGILLARRTIVMSPYTTNETIGSLAGVIAEESSGRELTLEVGADEYTIRAVLGRLFDGPNAVPSLIHRRQILIARDCTNTQLGAAIACAINAGSRTAEVRR